MKKTIAEVMAFTMLATTLVGCGHSNSVSTEGAVIPEKTQTEGATSEATGTKEEGAGITSHKFAFLPNTQDSTLQVAMNDTFKRLCDEKGYGYVCLGPDYDLDTQLSQMADVAIQNFDVVFVIPVDSAGIRQGLKQIHEKNIPILSVDTPVIDDDPDLVEATIATDACNAEALVGQQVAADYPDGAKITILDFPPSGSRVNRVAGSLDGLGDTKNKLDIMAQQDGAAALGIPMPTVEDIIQTGPDLDTPFCINDPSALGAAAAIKTSGKTEIGVYSINASPNGKAAILDGSFTAVAIQVPIRIAETVFEEAGGFLAGGEIEKEILLSSLLVDREEAEATLED